jgi:hypothetical protein
MRDHRQVPRRAADLQNVFCDYFGIEIEWLPIHKRRHPFELVITAAFFSFS